MRKFIKITLATITALIVFVLVGQSMLFIGPMLAGWMIMLFDIDPIGSQNVKTLESLGNIFNLIFSGYLGYRVYKKITRVKE